MINEEQLEDHATIIAQSITAKGLPGTDATGGTITSLTESVMGITAALMAIAESNHAIATSLDEISCSIDDFSKKK